MPWTASSFKSRHNKSLTKSQAKKAAKIANAILKENPGNEALAIATANKLAKKKSTKKKS